MPLTSLTRFVLGAMAMLYTTIATAASEYGADYAFLSLTSLSPDFSAANYTIRNNDGSDVKLSILRLPYRMDLQSSPTRKLQLEFTLAYQQDSQWVLTFPGPDEGIDATWTTLGGGLGLLFEQQLAEHLRFTPSLRSGVTKMENHATYYGVQTNLIKDTLDGTLLNWTTNASVTSLGLGLSYDWSLRDRVSSLKADVYHVRVKSFNESTSAVKFDEAANMVTLKADLIFPTRVTLADERLDLVLLFGSNIYFGENRDTLGYTTSYQAGLGSELPLRWRGTPRGHVRLSGQVLWADNLRGWLLTLGYNPN